MGLMAETMSFWAYSWDYVVGVTVGTALLDSRLGFCSNAYQWNCVVGVYDNECHFID